jgi:hypothetical protein
MNIDLKRKYNFITKPISMEVVACPRWALLRRKSLLWTWERSAGHSNSQRLFPDPQREQLTPVKSK